MPPLTFTITATDPCGARTGIVQTAHGSFPTPVFMPVGTRGAVKTMSPAQLRETGTTILLGNVYHLALRPGEELIAQMGGLHRFMAWDGSILTDSGGYQVFSLGDLCSISDEAAVFRSHIDGSRVTFTPERVLEIQYALGSDICMPLDQCTHWPCTVEQADEAVQRTLLWARRSRASHRSEHQALFGIVQGSIYPNLRARCARELCNLGFAGYAIGGLSIGEPKEHASETLAQTTALLPLDQPRYLMGVGMPQDILMAVRLGVDLFDCVLPTRNARNGSVFTWEGPLRIRNCLHRQDPRPIDSRCPCYTCRTFSRSYLHHLFSKKVEEILGLNLLTVHNLTFYHELMAAIRQAIAAGRYLDFLRECLQRLGSNGQNYYPGLCPGANVT